MNIMPKQCLVCVAPFYCELNGKCQKGLEREQKGNGSDGKSRMLTLQTLGAWGNESTVTPYSKIGDEKK